MILILWVFVLHYIERKFNINFHQLRNPELYQYKLLDQPIRRDVDHYTQIGYGLARERKIVITGLCRDIETNISKNIFISQCIAKYFKEYKIVLYENDSKDNTRNIIKEMAKIDPNIILIECDVKDCIMNSVYLHEIGSLSKERIHKMAGLRNKYLSFIKENLADYDYMMVVDFDIQGSTNINGIMNTIGREIATPWGGVCTMGIHPMPGTFGNINYPYDVLALIIHKSQLNYSGRFNIATNTVYQYIYNNYYTDLIPVHSAFGGMAIYNMNSIKDIWYNSDYVCEHIGFNLQIKNVYINPHWKTYIGLAAGPPNKI